MPLRAPSQCRQTLAHTPSSMAPSIWITDRMVFEAFQRYSLSSVRSTGADARCVHFNAGPLEHRRRAGKRRMTAVLPVSRLELPAWFVPVAQDNSPPLWAPPSRPSERHQKPGLLNQLIAWLEDYPLDKPFINPPTDDTADVPSIDDRAPSESQGVTGSLSSAALMASLRDELCSAPEAWKAQRAILNRYHEAIIPFLTALASFQTHHGFPGEREKTLLRCLLDPFRGQEPVFLGRMSLTARFRAHWHGCITRALKNIVKKQPDLHYTWILIELSKVLCEPRVSKTEQDNLFPKELSSDHFFYWCLSLKEFCIAKKELQPEQQADLIENMAHFVACNATRQEGGLLNARLGWAIALLWRPKTDSWKAAFDDVYSELTTGEEKQFRDERTFYLVMSALCLSRSIPRHDFASVFAHQGSLSHWAALYATLASQGVRAPSLLQKTNSLLERMNYTTEVAAAIRAETDSALHRSIDGLAIATGDYQATMRKYNEQVLDKSRSRASQSWSYQTWCLHMKAMIQDPKTQITDTTALFKSLRDRATVNGISVANLRREGKAKLLENMSHTLAYDAPRFRSWRVWKELQVWNQLYRKLTGQYSPKISLIMMDLTIARLERGELISTRRLNLMTNVVRMQAGEEQAQIFGERIIKWRDQNKTISTIEQKFPLRSRRALSPAEKAQGAGRAQFKAERQDAAGEGDISPNDPFGELIKAARAEGKLQGEKKMPSQGLLQLPETEALRAEAA